MGIDQAAQKCFDRKLEIPDPVNIRQFFQAAEMTADKSATVLMAAGSQYDWKKVKDQLDTLYPHLVKKMNTWNKGTSQPNWRHRSANEVGHGDGEDPLEYNIMAMMDDETREDNHKSLNEALFTYQQNRDRLRQTVSARGYLKSKGKGGGKAGKAGKTGSQIKGNYQSSPTCGGKTKGMSKEELNNITNCKSCGRRGH